MRPFFKVSSGSYSRMTKIIKHPQNGSPNFQDEVKMKKREHGSVQVELWDRNSSRPENLIGKGEVKYSSFANHEGTYEEWIPLFDNHGKEVGKALVEINISKVDPNISIEEMYKRSIQDMDNSFKKAIENFHHTFDHFGRFALPSEIRPQLTTGGDEGSTTTGTSSENQIKPEGENDNRLMNYRSIFDSTFDEMHNMFERTLEEMHNTFERMSREMFRDFYPFENNADKKKEKKDTNVKTSN